MKDTLQLNILWTLVNIMKRESTKVHWKLSFVKKKTLHFKKHCTKIDDISLVIIRFSFSQTKLVLIDISDSFCYSLFTFLLFDFWYSTDFRYSTKFIQCPYAFFMKTSKVNSLKMLLLCLIFHETLLPVNGENNSWR